MTESMTTAEIPEITSTEIMAFTRHDYYSNLFESLKTKNKRWPGFNISAFVFGSNWFFYRKMPVIATAYIAIFLAIVAGISSIDGSRYVEEEFEAFRKNILFASLLAQRFAFALLANYLYLRKAGNVIHQESQHNYTNEIYISALRAKGGTTFLVPITVNILVAVLLVVVNG